MGGGTGAGEYVEKKLGRFIYIRKIEQQDNVKYIFPNEDFYNCLHMRSQKDTKEIIGYNTPVNLLINHIRDCTILSQIPRNSKHNSINSLSVINPNKSKRNKAISKLVEILK